MFEKIYIEISNICNLQCTFCPEVVREKKIIKVDQFRKYAEQAKPLTKQVCLHLMGEPLGHPEFQEIAKICTELDLKIFLTTNGTLLKKHSEFLLNWPALEQINFSVHSYFANTKQYTLNQYLEPILSFCQQAREKEKPFYINLRLWNLEKTNFQKDQNQQIFDILENRFDLKINSHIDVLHNKSKRLFHKTYIHFDTEFIWPDLKQPIRSQKGTCYGLRKQLAIHANGDVVPCCLDKENTLNLGNLEQAGIGEILDSPKAKKIKNGFEQNQLVEDLCQRCQYADRFRK